MVFVLMHSLPGDPVKIFLGDSATPEQVEYYTKEFGLDQPLYVQYFSWINGLLHGELGRSITYKLDVKNLMLQRLACTVSITLPAFIIALVIGVIFGVITSVNRGKPKDYVLTSIANVGIATPSFWVGILLVYVFSLKLAILPVQGYVSPTESLTGYLKCLVLPVIVLSLGHLASTTRQTRSSMLEVVSQDYIRTARSKGLSEKTVIYKHALRNALIPIVTMMGGAIGGLIGGTVVIESLFNIPGIGSLMLTAITNKDYMVVQNVTFFISLAVVIANLVVDILYGVIDPRIRVE